MYIYTVVANSVTRCVCMSQAARVPRSTGEASTHFLFFWIYFTIYIGAHAYIDAYCDAIKHTKTQDTTTYKNTRYYLHTKTQDTTTYKNTRYYPHKTHPYADTYNLCIHRMTVRHDKPSSKHDLSTT